MQYLLRVDWNVLPLPSLDHPFNPKHKEARCNQVYWWDSSHEPSVLFLTLRGIAEAVAACQVLERAGLVPGLHQIPALRQPHSSGVCAARLWMSFVVVSAACTLRGRIDLVRIGAT